MTVQQVTEIEDCLRDRGHLRLLDLLPSSESMRWLDCRDANPPKALVIGSYAGEDIIAFLIQQSEIKPAELRFRSKSWIMTQDDIAEMPDKLISPFCYVAGTSKAEKGRTSIFIKWYWMKTGLVSSRIGGDFQDLMKRFQRGLFVMRDRMAEGKGAKERNGKQDPRAVIGDTDDEEEAQEEEMPARTRQHRRRSSAGAPFASPKEFSKDNSTLRPDTDARSDYTILRNHLKAHSEVHLLDNLPTAEEMEWFSQQLVPKALPKKLYVGKMYDNSNKVFAYMRFTNNWHEIRFYGEDEFGGIQHLNADLASKQMLIHPFNKLYEKVAEIGIDQQEKARLTLIVKWYFIAGGVSGNVVLKETKSYPDRFRGALQYIAERMGRGAAKSQGWRSSPQDNALDESRIQDDLDARPVSSHSARADAQQPATGRNDEPSHNRKRTAEDAQLEDLNQSLGEDRTLTGRINTLDDRIDILEMQTRALLDDRAKLDEERKSVRKRLKRQSLAFASMAEEE